MLLLYNLMNRDIIEQFNLLIKQIKFDISISSGKKKMINSYRLNSIQNALGAIKKFNQEIKNSDQVKNLAGIGKGTLKRIDEIIKTGKLVEIKLPTELEFIDELEEVYGIGKKIAYDLFKKYNIKNIHELKEKYKNGEINLPDNIVKGIKHYDKIKDNIPRETIDEVYDFLTKTLLEIDKNLFGIVCGSYRRLNLTSGDVDYIIVNPKYITKEDSMKSNIIETVITKLKEKGFIYDSLTDENVPTKYMGLFKWKSDVLRRIDIRFIPYESYYTAILYFTGSKNLNKKMRRTAITMGYTLNEYGLFDENNKMFKVNSEKEIFDILGMEYLSPELRK